MLALERCPTNGLTSAVPLIPLFRSQVARDVLPTAAAFFRLT